MRLPQAVPWQVETWLNSPQPLSLESLRGKVIVLHAFQMLCPGCVSHGLPQAQRLQRTFAGDSLAVIGLHSVFEHHEAMTKTCLKAFVHEYRLNFPIAIDQPNGQGLPKTMAAYAMRGTPSLILIDQVGRIRFHQFGVVDDLVLGAHIGALLEGPQSSVTSASKSSEATSSNICDVNGLCNSSIQNPRGDVS